MTAKQAKDVARQWVLEEGSQIVGLSGAYLAGSTLWLDDAAPLPPTSDVDVVLVFANPPPLNLRKFHYRDVLLEVSYMPSDQLQSAKTVLESAFLAGSFSVPNIIWDPSGHLTRLQAAIAREFARHRWVHKRCQHAGEMVLNALAFLSEAEPFHKQVTSWLFGTSLTTYMLLVAGLKNPTVRKRYMATQELLAEYGHLDFYESLLTVLGCAQISRGRAEEHLAALTEVFDVAKRCIKTPYRFASDISDAARPIAIGGSQALIERGYHREAIFYMLATYSRCQHILYHDAPLEVQARFDVGYRHFLGDLGIASFADLEQRREQVIDSLPQVWKTAEAIMKANPGIKP